MMAVDSLRRRVRGKVLTASDPGFDAVRRVRNARIDRHPALIVRCSRAADVRFAIEYANEHGLPVAVRGGGSHVAGWGTCDGGVLVDLGLLKRIEVDPDERTATVEPGVCWGELDGAAQRWGLALPGARIHTVGISGQTLGGGVGDLSRQFGLTADSSTFFELVSASGDPVRASSEENPELFWGLRGGGGNFGAVTRFGFRLHPVEQVIAGPLVYPLARAHASLCRARDWLEAAPEQASLVAFVWTAPPGPLLPPELHYEKCLVLVPSWFGEPSAASALLQPLRGAGLAYDGIRLMSYLAYHRLLPSPPNYREQNTYNRGEMLPALCDETVGELLALFERTGPSFSLVFGALGGMIARSPAGPTAFPHRSARWFVELCAQWFGDPLAEQHVAPVLEGTRLLRPTSGGPYANLLPDADGESLRGAYGAQHARLAELKRRWDPGNLFRFNVNIQPAAATPSRREERTS